MAGRKRGWGDESIGADKAKTKGKKAPTKQSEIELDIDLDDDEMLGLLDEVKGIESEEADEPEPVKKKKVRKKRGKKAPEPEPEEEEADEIDDLLEEEEPEPVKKKVRKKKRGAKKVKPVKTIEDDDPFGIDDEDDGKPNSDPEPECADEAQQPAEAIKKKRKTSKAAESETEDMEDLLDTAEPKRKKKAKKSATEEATEDLGVEPSLECPVCRDMGGDCKCPEEDRAFVRRTRFGADVKDVGRCPRCGCPMSPLYLPRPGQEPPYELSQIEAVWTCLAHNRHGAASALFK